MTINDAKLRHGTVAWFEMVGTLMSEAASMSGLSPALSVTLVERYTDGAELHEGFVQGIRFEIAGGKPSFRVGVRPGERAEVTIEITAAAARKLNSLKSADPAYPASIARFVETGEMRLEGDLSRLGGWLETVHDRIVSRTLQPSRSGLDPCPDG